MKHCVKTGCIFSIAGNPNECRVGDLFIDGDSLYISGINPRVFKSEEWHLVIGPTALKSKDDGSAWLETGPISIALCSVDLGEHAQLWHKELLPLLPPEEEWSPK